MFFGFLFIIVEMFFLYISMYVSIYFFEKIDVGMLCILFDIVFLKKLVIYIRGFFILSFIEFFDF